MRESGSMGKILLYDSLFKFNFFIKIYFFLELLNLREDTSLIRSEDLGIIGCLKLYESIKSESKACLIFYEKYSELKRLAEVECDLLEVKFKIALLDYLKRNFLDVLKMNRDKVNDANFNEYINILFNLVLEKRTMIVK